VPAAAPGEPGTQIRHGTEPGAEGEDGLMHGIPAMLGWPPPGSAGAHAFSRISSRFAPV